MVSSLALDAGGVWLVGALIEQNADPVTGAARVLWLVGLALVILVAGLVGALLTADSAVPFRVLAGLLAATVAGFLAVAPADGLDISARLLLLEAVVVLVLGAAAMALSIMARRRSLV
jgi:hypothetical protein